MSAVIPIVIIIWLILIYRTLRRPNRRWLPARLLLTTLAVTALALAGLRPTHAVRSRSGATLLLTGRMDQGKLDSLLRALRPEFLFTLDPPIAERAEQVRLLPDLDYLLNRFRGISNLHIVGDGLTPEELDMLRDYELHFHLNDSLPPGIVSLGYTPVVLEGGLIRLNGVFHHTGKNSVSLKLGSPAGDKILLNDIGQGMHPFRASLPAQAAGRYLLSLTASSKNGKTGRSGQLPLVIEPALKPRVLILNEAPSFETRFLKNWLASKGYPLAVRSVVSKGKTVTEFENGQTADLSAIRLSTLSGFDMLVMESGTLPALENAELDAIGSAVREGLGICLILGENPPLLKESRHHFFLGVPHRPGGASCRIAGLTREAAKAPFVLLDKPGVFPILKDEKGQILAAFNLHGQGRIAHSVLADTYQWLLEGKNKVYARTWTDLLEGVMRREERLQEWELPDPPLLFTGYPLALSLITGEEQPAIRVIAPDSAIFSIPPIQHPFLEDHWTGTFWPRQSGWHQVTARNPAQPETWFFVQKPGAWESLRTARCLEASRKWAAQRRMKSRPEPADRTNQVPYPLWWFYLLFLTAAGLLWLEERW